MFEASKKSGRTSADDVRGAPAVLAADMRGDLTLLAHGDADKRGRGPDKKRRSPDKWRRSPAGRRAAGLVCAAVLASASIVASVTSLAAETITFELSTGAAVPLPSLDNVRCTDILPLLVQIDETRYREFSHEPPADPNDFRLYKYESELVRRLREDCSIGMLRASDKSGDPPQN